MSIMNIITDITRALYVRLFGKPDKSAHIIPTLTKSKQTCGHASTDIDPNALYAGGHKYIPGQAPGEHVRADADKGLSAQEITMLMAAGLSLEKATYVKSLKAKPGYTQEMVSERLGQIHGRGYSVPSISPIWAILNKCSGVEAAPPPPPKRGGRYENFQLEVVNTDNQ